jgi:malignant T-cell-amplified sequence
MCRGLTTTGAEMDMDVKENTVVAIMAEGKENACAIGFTCKSSEDM